MTLSNIVIGCVNRDRLSLEYTQKAINFINLRYGTVLPRAEDVLSSGTFSAGEFDPQFRVLPGKKRIPENVSSHGKNIYLFGISTIPSLIGHHVSPGELRSRLCDAAQAAYDNGAKLVRAVMPDLPYSRADKTSKDFSVDSKQFTSNLGRGATSISQARTFYSAGIEDIITIDLHSEKVAQDFEQVYGRKNVIHSIDPNPLFAHYLVNESGLDITENGEKIVIVSPDKGAKPKIDALVEMLQQTFGLNKVSAVYLDKIRKIANNADALEISVGGKSENFTTLTGKIAIIPDDIVDTAGTFSGAAKQIKQEGIVCNGHGLEKPSGVIGIFTHPALKGMGYEDAMKKILSANTDQIVFGNTHPFIEDNMLFDLKRQATIIRTANLVGEAIYQIETGNSIDDLFKVEGHLDKQRIRALFNKKISSSHPLYQGN